MTRETREGGGAPPTTRDSHGGEKGSSHKGKGKISLRKDGRSLPITRAKSY
jgi:hypothetical protein